MKNYPHNEVEVFQGFNFGSNTIKVVIPTKEAIDNFETYLEADELNFYKSLSDDYKIDIALCVNPFNRFKEIYDHK